MTGYIKSVLIYSAAFVACLAPFSGTCFSLEEDYEKAGMAFEHFIQCELTRKGTDVQFNNKPFTITTVNLFDVKKEGNLFIVTGAVQCWVNDSYQTLYAAVGIKKVLGNEKVSYYCIRKHDFSILASEILKYPYKYGCPWDRYRIDLTRD